MVHLTLLVATAAAFFVGACTAEDYEYTLNTYAGNATACPPAVLSARDIFSIQSRQVNAVGEWTVQTPIANVFYKLSPLETAGVSRQSVFQPSEVLTVRLSAVLQSAVRLRLHRPAHSPVRARWKTDLFEQRDHRRRRLCCGRRRHVPAAEPHWLVCALCLPSATPDACTGHPESR